MRSQQVSFPDPILPKPKLSTRIIRRCMPRSVPRIELQNLLVHAQQATGLTHVPHEYFLNGLRHLIAALKDTPSVHFMGRHMFKRTLFTNLVQHLQILEYLRQNPEIKDVPVKRPIFILGLPRSGTSLLHNLLSLDQNARPVHYWEAIRPYPSPEPATCAEDPTHCRGKTHSSGNPAGIPGNGQNACAHR